MGLECHLPKTHRNLTGKKRKTMWVLKNLRANAAINDCIASVSLSAFKQLPAMCARPTRTLYFSSQGRNQLTGFYCWSFLGLIKTWAKQTPPVTGEKEKNKIKGKNSLKEKKKKKFFPVPNVSRKLSVGVGTFISQNLAPSEELKCAKPREEGG